MIAVLFVLLLLLLLLLCLLFDDSVFVLPVAVFRVRRLVVRTGIKSGSCGEGTDTVLLQVGCSAMHQQRQEQEAYMNRYHKTTRAMKNAAH